MNVLLLKEPRESDSGLDPYIKELDRHGLSATLVPVLSFKFVSLNALSDRVFQPERHGGLIFTSPRAVEAVKMCIDNSTLREEWNAVKEKWNAKSVYVVGSATASLVHSLGLIPQGEHTGTADVLSRLIVQRENVKSLPLLFPCGALKREVLPKTLRENGIPLETITVYQTVDHPDVEINITRYFSKHGVPASIAFFSPSGVRISLELLKRLVGPRLDQIKFAAIGPTTADALEAEGLRVSCLAEKPTPQHLADSVAHALGTDLSTHPPGSTESDQT
ncbi:uroporphyrinogen-III synthase [Brachyhypopomus gauderio]|uniref:uroporphyrinogen-III synthase n=1 Tax=Brachyhypopomus gauderio TaxID=698409 RepID=UPI00404143E5